MNKAELEALIEEATVDCYDVDEAFWGFLATLQDSLDFPFKASVMGDKLSVVDIDGQRSDTRRGIMVSVQKRGTVYTCPLSEIDASELSGQNAGWIRAYQLWSSY